MYSPPKHDLYNDSIECRSIVRFDLCILKLIFLVNISYHFSKELYGSSL
jgi:hypothetical protein